MPNEQPCLRENGPCAPSSKNANDKGSSTTMLVIRDTKHADDSNRRDSSCSSEKDSGYSDGSDWQQTDVEDQKSNKRQLRVTEHAEAPHTGQPEVHDNRNTGNPTVVPTNLAQPPVYIMKQSAVTQKRSQLRVGNSMRISNLAISPRMIIVEQPNVMAATRQLLNPLSRTSSVTEKKMNSTYLPILNSYPRIAPHPAKKLPDKSSSNQESHNLSKRMCTERRTEDISVTRGLSEEHHHKQPKLRVSNSVPLSTSSSRNSPSSSTFPISSTNPRSPSSSSLHTASSDSLDGGSHRNITTSTRRCQFLNTVELLRRSGLLDITLRTKELLRQSNATEQDISQLRQHTELLCQAVSNPGHSLNGVTAWERLCQAMAESGSYPDLKLTQTSQNPSHLDPVSQPQGISSGNKKIPQAAESSCLFTSSSEQSLVKQDGKRKTSEKSPNKVPFMSPDSSTG